LVVIALASFRFASFVSTASRTQRAGNKKAAVRERRSSRFPQDQRRCSCGPPLDRPGVFTNAGLDPFYSSSVPTFSNPVFVVWNH
jgi:hypothetical protein